MTDIDKIDWEVKVNKGNFTKKEDYLIFFSITDGRNGGAVKFRIEITETGNELDELNIDTKTNLMLYLFYSIAFILLLLGLLSQDTSIVSLSAILFMVLGLWILKEGFVGLDNILTLAIGSISICLGAYIWIRTNIETIQSLI